MFLFRMLSVKKVKNRSAAFGPSAAITAGMAVVVVRATVAGSVVGVVSEGGLIGKFMVGFSGPDGSHKGRYAETIATLPGGWDLAHAIRLGIKPFAELGANSEALSGSQVDSPCSCRAIFESAPVAMLQSRDFASFFRRGQGDQPTSDDEHQAMDITLYVRKLLTTHFRTSSTASIATMNGTMNSHTRPGIGAVPKIARPHGV